MRKGWRAFAIFMAMVMVIAFLPTAAFAQDDGAVSDDAILDAENAVEGFDAPETQEDDASDETDTVEGAGDMTETDEVDDSFGGFAGDDEFLVDDEFAEDELPVEDEVSTEDSELAEDIAEAGIMLLSSGLPTLVLGEITVTFVDMGGNELKKCEPFVIEDYKNTTVTADTLVQNGIDLTNGGNYTVMKYGMTLRKGNSEENEVQNDEFIEVPADSWHSLKYRVFVIPESKTPGATITLDIQFVEDKEDGTEANILSRPEGYAIGYTAKLSTDSRFLAENTYDIDRELTLENKVYRANFNYYNRLIIGKAKNTEMVGYEFKEMELGEFKVEGGDGVAVAYDDNGNELPNTYWVALHTSNQVAKATLTIINHYTKVDTYTVTWYGFANEELCTATVNADDPIPACPEGEPYNETYAFDGWNDPVRDTDGNYTITSEWIAPHAVKVEGRNEKFVEQTVKHGEFALEPTYEITKEGHTFGGWELNGKPFDFATTPITEDNLEITINWIPKKRTVTWMNGETEVTKTEVDYGTAATAPELTAPEGYRLAGWTIAGEGGTAVDFDLETTITENITLSAKWIKQVTHTWMDGVNSEPLKTETADEGAEVTAPANPTRSGYTFNGWTSVTDEWGNVTYTAQWGANSSGGGGTGGGGTGGGSTGGDNTGDNAGGDNTGGNGSETIGGGEGGEGSDPADENDPNSENGGLVDIDDENTALGDRPFTFIDVTKNDWFYDAVYAVWEKELMNGTTATTFEPQTMTTRGMLVTILYRMEGSPEVVSPNSFSDVAADMYYAKAVAWAAENGIVTGYDDETFGPEDVLLREQTAAILYRYAKYKGMDVATDGALEFDDADMIGGYAQDAMLWAVSVGLINGVDENTLAPKDGTERSHMATLLTRLVAMTEAKDDTKEG